MSVRGLLVLVEEDGDPCHRRQRADFLSVSCMPERACYTPVQYDLGFVLNADPLVSALSGVFRRGGAGGDLDGGAQVHRRPCEKVRR